MKIEWNKNENENGTEFEELGKFSFYLDFSFTSNKRKKAVRREHENTMSLENL